MILLDTHAWWWSLSEPERLSKRALKAIRQAKADERAIAAISIWEFAMMAKRKRIELKITVDQWLDYAINRTGLKIIELSPKIAIESCDLPGEFHNDPADRIIVATARVHTLDLITKDKKIIDYPHIMAIW